MSYFKIDWIYSYLKKSPSVILDVGSYNGAQAKVFKTEFPNSRVIAIEADELLYNKMVNNKNIDNVEIFNFAICDKNGEIFFHHNNGKRKSSGSIKKPSKNIFKFDGMSFSEPKKINSTRIDTFCNQNNIKKIDVLHMDIQGAEYEAIIGMGNFRPSIIFLEVNGYNFYENVTKTKDILINMGYNNICINDISKGDELWVLN